MAQLKALLKDTAIYGLSSIIGRFLNYMLVPLYTAKLSAASGGYGVITNIYSYVALILVILTFGMETTFFRFANRKDREESPDCVFTTSFVFVGGLSLLWLALVILFISPISQLMGYGGHAEYVWMMAVVVALDAIQAVPFARLRYQKRPIRFAALKMLFIVLNIGLNLLYFVGLPKLYEINPQLVSSVYDPTVGAGYAFFVNLICTTIITFFFVGDMRKVCWQFSKPLLREMLAYSWPLLLLGIAGILNQTADKILFPYLYGEGANTQLGIYGAASKIAMIMAMITQAFRYAYEPFVFGKSNDADSKQTYAEAMKFFVIFTLLAFCAVMAYMPLLKYIIAPDYWEGLDIVPIVMAAEILMGIYFNLSFWYKLTDRTIWGAWFSGIGCAVLVAGNVLFVPQYSYVACAWSGVAGYGTAMLLSYFVGRKHYPIDYPIAKMALYTLATVAVCCAIAYIPSVGIVVDLAIRTVILAVFLAVIVKLEMPELVKKILRKI